MEDMSMEFNMQNKSDLVRPKNIAMIVLCVVLSICAIGATIKYLFVNDELVATTNGPTTIMSGTPITIKAEIKYSGNYARNVILQAYVDQYYVYEHKHGTSAADVVLLVDKNLVGTYEPSSIFDVKWISITLRYESPSWQTGV
jgi:hypothetical protein